MESEITIKRLTTTDWKILREIRLDALRTNPDVFLKSVAEEEAKSPSHWTDMVKDETSDAIFGLYDTGQIIGLTGAFRWKDSPSDTVILGMSFIKPAYRGRNLSELLYKARIDWAWAQSGITRIIVSHREGNEASKAANQKWGFVFYGTEIITYGDGTRAKNYKYELRKV